MRPADFLTPDEIRAFTRRSDWLGAREVLGNWLLIGVIFAAVATWTNPLTILLAIPLLGGRQLGLAILMHEAGHKTLFRSQRLNAWVGQWLCAYPVLGDCEAYGASHRQHHRLAGTPDDPDLPNYRAYPISRASLRRKLWRDLTGQTGVKLLASLVRGSGGRMMMREGETSSALLPGLLVNALLLLALTLAGVPELYLLWVVAYLTAYPLIARIRQVAEHANVPDLFDADPRMNTRTTYGNWLERLTLCPNRVNYHIEHHLLPSVPSYRLPALHRLLRERGFYEGYEESVLPGYLAVIRRAVPELASAGA